MTSTTYFPWTIIVRGTKRHWNPRLSHYIGNFGLAKMKAADLRAQFGAEKTVRRFGCCVNVYESNS